MSSELRTRRLRTMRFSRTAAIGLGVCTVLGAALALYLYFHRSNKTEPTTMADSTAETFDEAAALVASGVLQLSKDDKLKLYGLYKQATSKTPASAAKAPSSLDFVAAAKHKAWLAVSGMKPEQAREMYIAVVQQMAGTASLDRMQQAASGSAGPGDGMGSGYSSRPVQQATTTEEKSSLGEDLHFVARTGGTAAVKALLARLAAKTGQSTAQVAGSRNEAGETPLHAAADGGNLEAVQALLEAGTDVNAAESEAGQTAMHYACTLGLGPVAVALAKAGADLALKDADGYTPWEAADDAVREKLMAAGFGQGQ